tara:strand:+ start:68273 stop:68686 length:414 start_codon:yes stop_codon:yes gene_type:complete
MEYKLPNKLIIYDDYCKFCNFWVWWIIKKDKLDLFKFTGIESKIGVSVLKTQYIDNLLIDSIIYVKGGKVSIKSKGVLLILKDLNLWYSFVASILLKIGLFGFYNLFYDFIAKHRHRLFGKRTSCIIPTDHQIKKFI